MNILRNFLFVFILISTLLSCKKEGATNPTDPTPPPITPPPPPSVNLLIPLPSGWKYDVLLTGNLPAGIQVYRFDSIFDGRTTRAFCVAYDSKLPIYEIKPVMSTTARRPSEFLSSEPGIAYACINGGFFGSGQSFSLVKYNNVVSAPNIRAVNRNFGGSSVPYYPTRAAFGVSVTGVPSAEWVYNVSSTNNLIYKYPSPSSNAEGTAPQPQPTQSFPAGGSEWEVASAIGGSPMLLKGGEVRITDVQELININNNSPRPRSAIGYTENRIVLMVAVEGDNTAGGFAGLSLPALANFMKNLGCTDAINLDGGGSTSLAVGSRLTVRPGDGSERPVISAVILKRK
jgi:hypothetical protein